MTTLGHEMHADDLDDRALPGVLVRSNGGVGGAGGNTGAGMGSAAGDAGIGGAGNTATAIINGSVSTSGSYAYGVLAQSIGGAGNAGGDADSVFGAYGGASKNGGAGGNVYKRRGRAAA